MEKRIQKMLAVVENGTKENGLLEPGYLTTIHKYNNTFTAPAVEG